MKIYYLYENDRQEGPFSIDELKEKRITAQTPIWKEGMSQWAEASKIEDLVAILTKVPPRFNQKFYSSIPQSENNPTVVMTATEKTGFKIGKFLGWTGVVVMLFLLISFIIAKSQESPFREKSPEELRAELLQTERLNPRNYINNNGKWRKNLIGETVLEGTLSNSASVAGFKDIVLEVEWMSKTEAVMGLRQLIVYEFIGAGKSVNYKLKAFGPSKFQGVRINVISATPLN